MSNYHIDKQKEMLGKKKRGSTDKEWLGDNKI